MSKGLGNRQREILRVIGELSGGGGRTPKVYRKIKEALYPDLYRSYPEPMDLESARIIRGLEKRDRARRRAYPMDKAVLNRLRVSITASVSGLIKRGYLQRIPGGWTRSGETYITPEGREIIKP